MRYLSLLSKISIPPESLVYNLVAISGLDVSCRTVREGRSGAGRGGAGRAGWAGWADTRLHTVVLCVPKVNQKIPP